MSFDFSQSECDLAGAGVLVTRAVHQCEPLSRLIAQHNGRPVRFPVVEIAAPPDPRGAAEQLGRLDDQDILIFVSPNAVQCALDILSQGKLPDGPILAAVGRRTAQSLAEAGYPVDVVPESGFDSEALLATRVLQRVAGRRITIVRGVGGRALLGDTLGERGAQVSYAEVYQRVCPDRDASALRRNWSDQVDLVTVTSNDLLDNLISLLGEPGVELLRQTPMVVVSERMREYARSLGYRQVILARGAGDRAILQALCAWVSGSP